MFQLCVIVWGCVRGDAVYDRIMVFVRRRNPRSRLFGCLVGVIAVVTMVIVVIAVIAVVATVVIVGAGSDGSGEGSSGDGAPSSAPASSGHWSNGG